MKVRDVMSGDVVAVSPDMPLRELARILAERRISGAPVVDSDGAIVGVVSEGDLVAKQATRPVGRGGPIEWLFGDRPSPDELRRRAATTVGEAMHRGAVTVTGDRPLREAAALMIDRKVNRLPVTEGDRLIGIVTRADLVRAYLERDAVALRVIREDVIRDTMWLDPDELDVEVREGTARIGGRVDRRSTATILEKLIGLAEGVDQVESELSWELDDRALEPPSGRPREPGAANITSRERPRQMHR